MEVLPLDIILLAASLRAGPPSKTTCSNVFHREVGRTVAYLVRTGTALRVAGTADATGRSVTGFKTGGPMSKVLLKDRPGSVSLLKYCDSISRVGEGSEECRALEPRC